MSDASHIEWTDATWQPITGCTILSPGCINCYAMTLAAGRLRNHPSRKGLTKPSKAGPVWTGEVRFNEQWLDQPLRWTKPRMIFVCAHGDLFHESVPDEWIDQVFAVMALCPQHTFQVLTKRAERMREYFSGILELPNEPAARDAIIEGEAQALYAKLHPGDDPSLWLAVHMPLPNVWLGVSAERQQEADERIPLLLQTPAAVRFVSAEPLLGPIDLTQLPVPDVYAGKYADHGYKFNALQREDDLKLFNAPAHLDWIIVGGESGKHARPMHPNWARSLREQCKAADVKFFFKQWGEHGRVADQRPTPDHLPIDADTVTRVGKKAAGRLLDGKEHNEFPSSGVMV